MGSSPDAGRSPLTSGRLALFLTSLSLLTIELVLTRIFSVTLGYHFAFLVISVAVFGLSLAGIIVYLLPARFPAPRLAVQASALLGLLPISLLALAATALVLPIDPVATPLSLALLGLLYLVATLPFLLGGLVVTLLFTHRAEDISRLYFADLLGAGTGSLLVLPLVNRLGGPTALLASGVPAALGAVVFAK